MESYNAGGDAGRGNRPFREAAGGRGGISPLQSEVISDRRSV